MSLVIVKEPTVIKKPLVRNLKIGTRFIDVDKQIYSIVQDDRSNEKRVLCIGSYFKPFLPNVPLSAISIERILEHGTLLKISNDLIEGENNDQ